MLRSDIDSLCSHVQDESSTINRLIRTSFTPDISCAFCKSFFASFSSKSLDIAAYFGGLATCETSLRSLRIKNCFTSPHVDLSHSNFIINRGTRNSPRLLLDHQFYTLPT